MSVTSRCKTGQGWTQEPYWPAPFKEVEAQQDQLRQMAEERGLLPSAPAPIFFFSCFC